MDQHPENPKHQHSSRPFRLTARGRALAVVAVFALAAGTLGTGVYLNRGSPTWQRILGTEPVIERVPKATDELPVLLEALDYILQFPKTTTSAKTTEALEGTESVLEEHVELLTPGALAALSSAAARETTGADPEAPPAAIPPLSPPEFAWRLAQTGNDLLEQALAAPEQESRRLAGSGIELGLQARTVLLATGAAQEKIEALPAPAPLPADGAGASTPSLSNVPEAEATPATASPEPSALGDGDTTTAQAGLPEFEFASCPVLVPGDTGPSDGAGVEAQDTSDPGPSEGAAVSLGSGQLLGEVIDAAYRLGYAYDVAGARTNAGLRTTAWDRSGVLVDFAESLEGQLDEGLDCAPLRQPAYQLPADAIENPMDSAHSGEGQLALLLRDAAAAQTGNAREYLFTAAWDHGLYTQQVTGTAPDFTQVKDVRQEPETAPGSPAAPGN
ncbi:hypothetical protein [Paeniglutamicibacter antarcticus]